MIIALLIYAYFSTNLNKLNPQPIKSNSISGKIKPTIAPFVFNRCELPEILQLNPAYIHSSAFRIKSMISSNELSLSTYASYNACFVLSIFRSGCRSSSSVESSSARTLYSLCFLITGLTQYTYSILVCGLVFLK